MAWNDNNNQNPWGGNGQTPPELDEVIKEFQPDVAILVTDGADDEA